MTNPSNAQSASLRVDTSIGELLLFPQRFEDIGPFSNLAPDDPPPKRLRAYLSCIASRDTASMDRGEHARLDEASCGQLSDDDIERIAEAYLSMPEVRKIAEGPGARAVPPARLDGEAASAYLDRLLLADHERQMQDLRATFESFRQRSGLPLSNALNELDRQASSLRSAAATAIRDDLVPETAETSASTVIRDTRRPRDREAEIELARSVAKIATQSALLLASLSESATQFVRQFAETARQSDEATRRSLRIAVAAVLISVIICAAALVVSITSYLQDRENIRRMEQWQESVLRTVKEAAAAQENRTQALDEKVRELVERQNTHPVAPVAAPTETTRQQPAGETAAPIPRESPKSGSATRASKRKSVR